MGQMIMSFSKSHAGSLVNYKPRFVILSNKAVINNGDISKQIVHFNIILPSIGISRGITESCMTRHTYCSIPTYLLNF